MERSELTQPHFDLLSRHSVNDLASAAAIINGLEKGAKARAEQKKAKAVYIHTSGTGELTDHSVPSGEFDKTVYDDANLKQIQASESSRT